MGLFFTLFYVFTAFIGPQTIFGELAQYHIQIVIAVITMVCSLPGAQGSGLLRIPQTYAILGLSAAVFFSLAFNGWISGGPIALMDFLPNAMGFFFVLLNCRKKSHLQMLIVVLIVAALFTTARACIALRTHDMESPYLLTMISDDFGGQIIRIRGLSFISDPNDLAQFFIGLIPCVFFLWGKGRPLLNFLFVYLPIAGLIFGMFLTHSRGGMVALLAVAIVAGRRRIGVIPATVVGVLLFAGLSVVGWSGGREVSAASGSDRMDAWGVGLGLVRMHPFFGVGFRRFADFNEITAHNTVVVCAAELGLIGFFFWMLFIFPTVRDAVVANSDPDPETQGSEAASTSSDLLSHQLPHLSARPALLQGSFAEAAIRTPGFAHNLAIRSRSPAPARFRHNPPPSAPLQVTAPAGSEPLEGDTTDLPLSEIRRLSSLMVVSFAGFLTAGWFLSRAYVMTLFINAGIVAVIYRMARERGIAPPILTMGRAAKLSILTCLAFLLLVYIILRADHFLPK